MSGAVNPPSGRPIGLDPSVPYIHDKRGRRDEEPPGEGGGGDPPDEMRERIERLEAGHATIIEKLNAIATKLEVMDVKLDAKADKASVASLEGKVVSVKEAIDTRASQAELNLLKGKVDTLPTTLQLIGFAVAVFVAAGLLRYFGH